MMAMGEKRAWEFAQENGLAAYLIIRGTPQGNFEVKITDKFDIYLQ